MNIEFSKNIGMLCELGSNNLQYCNWKDHIDIFAIDLFVYFSDWIICYGTQKYV